MLALIPKDPKLTVDRSAKGEAIRYCIDAKTEETLQKQRLALIAASGLLIYGSLKLNGSWWLKGATIGFAGLTLYTNMNTFALIRKSQKL
jgi:hypothetical protein